MCRQQKEAAICGEENMYMTPFFFFIVFFLSCVGRDGTSILFEATTYLLVVYVYIHFSLRFNT
jgi:hypothetical protein